MPTIFHRPSLVAALVAVVYLGQAQHAISHRLDYTHMDRAHASNGRGGSLVIDRMTAEGPVKNDGYDGQFSYYIALDPVGAAPYLGAPAYRYGRIGYPLVARALALGKPQRVRGALIIVNALSIAAATFFMGLILVRSEASAWWALLLGTFPGLMFVAFVRDTTEPLAYALALAATWIHARASVVTVRVAAASGATFALAGVTRETTLLFPLVLGFTLWRRRWAAVTLALTSMLPLLAWKAFLAWHFHDHGTPALLTAVPLGGITDVRPWALNTQGFIILTVLLPGVVWLVLAGRGIRSRFGSLAFANNLFLLFLAWPVFDGYGSAGRVATGGAASAFLAFPAVRFVWGRNVAVGGVLLWALPWWVLAAHLVT